MLFLGAMLLLAFSATARADSWAPPADSATLSPDGSHLLVLMSRDDRDAWTKRGRVFARRGTGAAFVGRHDVTIAELPAATLITDRGEVVLLDRYGSLGSGTILSIFGADGLSKSTFRLDNLYGPETAAAFPRSVSSIHWRCDQRLTGAQDAVELDDRLGGRTIVHLDGRLPVRDPKGAPRCRSRDGRP